MAVNPQAHDQALVLEHCDIDGNVVYRRALQAWFLRVESAGEATAATASSTSSARTGLASFIKPSTGRDEPLAAGGDLRQPPFDLLERSDLERDGR